MASPPKSPSPISSFLLFLTLFSQAHPSLSIRNPITNPNRPSSQLNSIPDVHDILPKFGLPKGLLPNNVKSYTLSDEGSFEIYLESTCYVQFDQLVYYEKKIKGKLSYGSVTDVSGIQAKKLFIWVSVTGIHADDESGLVEFYVGALSQKFPAKQFEDIPSCRSNACKGTGYNPEAVSGACNEEFSLLLMSLYFEVARIVDRGTTMIIAEKCRPFVRVETNVGDVFPVLQLENLSCIIRSKGEMQVLNVEWNSGFVNYHSVVFHHQP